MNKKVKGFLKAFVTYLIAFVVTISFIKEEGKEVSGAENAIGQIALLLEHFVAVIVVLAIVYFILRGYSKLYEKHEPEISIGMRLCNTIMIWILIFLAIVPVWVFLASM